MYRTERFFNTAGPIKRDLHYNIDPLKRIELDEIEILFHQQKYFVLHAPRQTGKTSCLLALRDYLNAQGDYWAVYANVEAGQAYRNDVLEVNRSVVGTIAEEASTVMGNEVPIQMMNELVRNENTSNLVASYLKRLCEELDRPLILLVDEIDVLVGDSLVSILRQIRSGYAGRPVAFPQSIILCGVRDVRDYRIVLSNQDIVAGGSAFNIKAKSLHLGNFTFAEVHELYMQHTPSECRFMDRTF